jgi:hypothetical protein
MRCNLSTALVAAVLAFSSHASGQVVIGTIGHSLTAEYQRPQSNRQAGLDGFNWVEILSRLRASEVSFGPYDAELEAPYDEPGGYAYNHAIGGALVLRDSMQVQVAGLAEDVAAGRIDAVVIWIGSLDFSVRMWTGGSFALDDPGFQSFQAEFVAALVDALDTLIAAGATDIALAQIGPADPNRSDIVVATNDTNDKLAAAVALRPEVSRFDALHGLKVRYDVAANSVRIGDFSALLAAAPSSELVAPPGGVTPAQCGFNDVTKELGCPTAAYQAHVIQDDGSHLTTPVQGLVANDVIAALRSRGFALTPLSDDEILTIAGVPPAALPALELRWLQLASRCKASTLVCRIKGKLVVRNGQASASDATDLRFLLSSDPVADSGDLVVGSRRVPTLRPGRQRKVRLKARLPAGVSTSGSYLLALPSVGPPLIQGPLD